MIILGNLIAAVASVLSLLIGILKMLCVIRALLSFVNPDPYNPIVQFVNQATEPLLKRIRKFIPNIGMFDISIIIAFFFFTFVEVAVVRSLIEYADRIRLGV